MTNSNSKYERFGGRPILEKITKVFYDKIYADEWIGKYFEMVPQNVIEVQQVDFMTFALGGPNVYCGKLPVEAHTHMMITPELFELRQKYLKEAMAEVGASQELVDTWLKIDEAFKNKIVKKSEDECVARIRSEGILSFPKPSNRAS